MVPWTLSESHERCPHTPKTGLSFLPTLRIILHSASLPGFAHGGQRTELNQTLPNGGGKLR